MTPLASVQASEESRIAAIMARAAQAHALADVLDSMGPRERAAVTLLGAGSARLQESAAAYALRVQDYRDSAGIHAVAIDLTLGGLLSLLATADADVESIGARIDGLTAIPAPVQDSTQGGASERTQPQTTESTPDASADPGAPSNRIGGHIPGSHVLRVATPSGASDCLPMTADVGPDVDAPPVSTDGNNHFAGGVYPPAPSPNGKRRKAKAAPAS